MARKELHPKNISTNLNYKWVFTSKKMVGVFEDSHIFDDEGEKKDDEHEEGQKEPVRKPS